MYSSFMFIGRLPFDALLITFSHTYACTHARTHMHAHTHTHTDEYYRVAFFKYATITREGFLRKNIVSFFSKP